MLSLAILCCELTHKAVSLTMKALEALHNRNSYPRLVDPAPNATELDNIFRSAFRAADHALLRPWRFLLVAEEKRAALGELFVEAARELEPTLSEEKLQRIRLKPLRAPLILITVCSPIAHPKVPEIEQELSAGAATQNMLLAAYAQGLGAIWRTGSMAYNKTVMRGLGLAEHEKIIAFVYLGTPTGTVRQLDDPPPAQYFQDWQP